MRGAAARKLRQQARREIQRRTRREVYRWWAYPRVFRAWALPGIWLVNGLARLGWKRPAHRWLAFIRSVPQRGTRLVVR